MKIGLLDIDCTTIKKHFGSTIYPNLALCKISAYHKALGDSVEWATPFEHYDVIYRSKIFNFTEDDRFVYHADKEIRGGTGYDIASRLPQVIDDMQPDLTIYPHLDKDTSFGFLTRGCPNKCKWCVVPKKEGAITPYWDVDRVANGRKQLVLMDNNILAAGNYCTEQLQKIIDRGYRVDFNQALDARLVNEENAKLLAKIKWIRYIRFGCDTPAQVAQCFRAMDLIEQSGYNGEFLLYTMLNDNKEECLERINKIRERLLFRRAIKGGGYCFPHAQPYRDPEKLNEPPQWQKDVARWCNSHSIFVTTDFEKYKPRKL